MDNNYNRMFAVGISNNPQDRLWHNVRNAINTIIPSDVRGVGKILLNKQNNNWSNEDFSEQQLNAIRQAVYNKQYENANARDMGTSPTAKNNNKFITDTISYENYEPIKVLQDRKNPLDYPYRTATALGKLTDILKNFYNPSFESQFSVGSADYMIDPAGYVTLQDTYNINPNTKLENKTLNKLHSLVRNVNNSRKNSFQTRLNLGNINDWDMNYTGNLHRGIAPVENNQWGWMD